jgi:hypothetical protein
VARAEPGDLTPTLMLLAVLSLLAWPVFLAYEAFHSARFARVVRKARGKKFELAEHGIRVHGGTATQEVSWDELAAARWLRHIEPSMASGPEEYLAVEVPKKGVALSDDAGDLQLILTELTRRNLAPQVAHGGKAAGMGGFLLTLIWLGAAGTAILLLKAI